MANLCSVWYTSMYSFLSCIYTKRVTLHHEDSWYFMNCHPNLNMYGFLGKKKKKKKALAHFHPRLGLPTPSKKNYGMPILKYIYINLHKYLDHTDSLVQTKWCVFKWKVGEQTAWPRHSTVTWRCLNCCPVSVQTSEARRWSLWLTK